MLKNVGKIALAVIAAYLVYIIATAIVPYIRPKSVRQEFADSVDVGKYYGEQPCADRVALVEAPLESLDTRIPMLDGAKETIDISYYAIHMGQSTDQFLGAIVRAADRGVKVRILLDGFFGGLTNSNKDYAVAIGAHPNISLRLYNCCNALKPWTWNGRLHDKYIIIDDRLLLLGGRNIGDKYFGPEGYTGKLSIDRDVLVYNSQWREGDSNSAIGQVRDYMDGLWDSELVKEPFAKDTKAGAEKRAELLRAVEAVYPEDETTFGYNDEQLESWTYPANKVTLLHNDTNIGVKEPKLGYVMGRIMLEAKESVMLQSPYVVLDRELEQLLTELGQKDIDYQILTNSMASSPNLPAFSAYMGDKKEVLATGARLWEFQSRDAIHAKTYVVDERMSLVGSYNLDPRSAYIDTELMLAIDSEGFAQHLKDVQDHYKAHSLEVGKDGKYIPGDMEAAPVNGVHSLLLHILSLPIRLVKYLV